ncbi:glycosyltransferase family 2 protein [Microbacterium sp.]|uniref:glycosyltransferase family 2 protein n=1 Tax=Microbacterium sp. TaxID=51671 RepID=UPI003C70DAD5
MHEPAPAFALVVVNYGSSAMLVENLAPLRMPEGGCVIVVDCFTDEAERARVAALTAAHGWHALLLAENVGFGAGVNAGAEVAIERGAEVIVTLNPDATISTDALTALVSVAAARRALVSPRIVTSTGAPWFAGADLYLDLGFSASQRRRPEFAGRPRREWSTGACFAISSSLWRELGGFDDSYFLYWEDVDLSHRVLDLDGELLVIDVTAVHDEGGTHAGRRQGRAKSETYYYYNIRNRLLYAAIHLDDEGVLRWLRSARRESYRVLLQGGRRQLLTSAAPWRAYRRGLRDGRALVRLRRPDLR